MLIFGFQFWAEVFSQSSKMSRGDAGGFPPALSEGSLISTPK